MKEALLPPKQGVQLDKQLQEFVEGFSQHLGRRERRYWCCKYLEGLLMPGERKSIQPISQRVADGNVQALHQFVCNSPWSAHQLSLGLSNWLIKQASQSQPGLLILDDTSLPKKGNHSVGVARQYCGALGKVANCQSIVSWHWAGSKLHLPLIGQVYLPKNWTQDQKRLDKARVPLQQRNFRTKWQIALDLFDQFCTQVPYKGMIFDAGYAELRPFLRELDKRKLAYLGQVPSHHCFWPAAIKIQDLRAAPKGRKRQYPEILDKTQKPLKATQWAQKLQDWKSLKLPLASGNKSILAQAIRVRPVHSSQAYYRAQTTKWLLLIKLADGTFKYYVSNLPDTTSLETLITWAQQRWKVEQGYQQLKSELGLDHFEGRSWNGLHHHWTLCCMAYVFLTWLRIKKNLQHLSLPAVRRWFNLVHHNT